MKFRKAIALLLALALTVCLALVGFAAEDHTAPLRSAGDKLRQSARPAEALSPLPGESEPMAAKNCTVQPNLTDLDRGILQNAAASFVCFFAAEDCGVRDTVLGIEIYPESGLDDDPAYSEYYYFNSGDQAGTQRFDVPAGVFSTLGTYRVYFSIVALDENDDMAEILQSVYLNVNVVDHEIPLESLSLKTVDTHESVTRFVACIGQPLTFYIALNPAAYTGGHSVSVYNPDPHIVDVQNSLGYIQFQPKLAGETDVTFECGSVQLVVHVTVRSRITGISTDDAVGLCVGMTKELYYSAGSGIVNSYIQTQSEDETIASIVGRDSANGVLWLKGVAPGTTSLVFSGDDYTKKVPVTVYAEHELVEVSRTEGTCTEPGTVEKKCVHCGAVVTEPLPALGHKVDPASATETQAPTATQPGYVTGTCTRCGQEARMELPPVFLDTVADSFYARELDYLYAHGIIKGMTENTFGPGNPINRGQLVVLLYRLSGETAGEGENPFRDVSEDSFVYDAVRWASANGIAQGYGDGTFLPGQPVTRAEMVTFIYRFAAHMGADMSAAADLSGYTDADQMLPYAKAPFAWAVASGLIKGTSEVTLGPGETANRAQCAVILYRYVQSFPSAAN